MTRRSALIFSKFDLGLLRIASLLVPRRQRSEWEMEWRSELWHVREACTPDRSLSRRGEREVTAFCLGAFQDAFCLWRESGQKRVPLATTKGSAVQCLRFLIALIAISYGVALLLPGVRAALQPSRSRMAPSLVLIRNARFTQDSVPTISAEQFQVWKLRKQHLFDGFAFYRVERGPLSNPSHGQTRVSVAHASLNLFELLGLSLRLPFSGGDTLDKRSRVILSDEVWRSKFGGDPDITGRVVMVDSSRSRSGRGCDRWELEAPGEGGCLAA